MFNEQQKKAKQSMQVKFSQYLEMFKGKVYLPEYKFIHEICLGILKTNSVICNKIAVAMNEEVSVKKVCERFTRHFNKAFLGDVIKNRIIEKQCRGFSDNTVIIVDDSDIVKSKARKMEGLKKVRDGSTGDHHKEGYDLLNIIAYDNTSEGYEIKPLSSDLISRDIEQDSLIQITEDRLVDIAIASGNKGVYVFDRGYDTRTMFEIVKKHGINYVIRSTGLRSLIVGGTETNFLSVAKSVKLTHQYKLEKSNKLVKCGIKRVSIRLNPHPLSHPETVETWLIVAQHEKDEKGRAGYFYLFCDFPGQLDLSDTEILAKALNIYGVRWKIEEVHRHLKQEYAWEAIQLISYTRLQNMNQLLLLAMCYLYSLKRFAIQYLIAFPAIMQYKRSSWKKIYDFVYYRLTRLVETCFSSVTRLNIQPYKGKWHEQQQLLIPGLENGGM